MQPKNVKSELRRILAIVGPVTEAETFLTLGRGRGFVLSSGVLGSAYERKGVNTVFLWRYCSCEAAPGPRESVEGGVSLGEGRGAGRRGGTSRVQGSWSGKLSGAGL